MNYTSKTYQLSETPLVSVMIPVYNQIEEFQKAVQSALDQTYPNFEIVICDDGSTDGNLLTIVDKWNDPRIRYYRNEQNLGMHGNFIRLLYELCEGEVATKIDADDYFSDPTLIEEAIRIFQSDSEISLVFGSVSQLITSTGQLIEDGQNDYLERVNDGSKLFYDYANGLTFPHTGMFFVRELALDYDCYRHRAMSEDWEAFLRMAFDRKVGYINRPIAIKTLHTSNFTKKIRPSDFESHASYVDEIYRKMKDHPKMDVPRLDDWYNKMRKRHHAKWLIKLWNLDRPTYDQYTNYLKKSVPAVWHLLQNDLRFRAFQLIKNNKFLMRMAFKYVLKQPSFIADLQLNQSN